MRYNGFKRKKFLVKQKCKEFLAFRSEVIGRQCSCSNNKSLNYKRHSDDDTVPYFFDYRVRPRIVAACSNTRHTHTNTTVNGLALGLFVLYNSFPWLTAELRGCVYYCHHLTVVAVSLLSSRHWSCLRAFQWNKRRPRIVATQKRATSSRVVWSRKYGSSFSWKLFLTVFWHSNSWLSKDWRSGGGNGLYMLVLWHSLKCIYTSVALECIKFGWQLVLKLDSQLNSQVCTSICSSIRSLIWICCTDSQISYRPCPASLLCLGATRQTTCCEYKWHPTLQHAWKLRKR